MPLEESGLIETNTPVNVDDAALVDALFEKKRENTSNASKGSDKEKGVGEGTIPANEEEPDTPEPDEEEEDTDTGDEVDIDDLDDEVDAKSINEEMEFEVKVDGQSTKVTLKELKDNYSGEKFIAKRVQQATEAKNAADQQAQSLYQNNQVALQKLQQVDQILGAFSQPNINWDELKKVDPLQYALRREEARDYQDKQWQISQEIQQYRAQQEQLTSDAKGRYIQGEADILIAKVPELADPHRAKDLMGKLTAAALHYGYTEEEVSGVMDHRAMLVLNDASKYRALLAKKAAAKEIPSSESAPAVKAMRTTATKPAATGEKSRIAALTAKARRTGNPDDVAELMFEPRKARR